MINRIDHWSLTRERVIPDDSEEVSALDLVGKNTKKINEIVDDQNTLSKKQNDDIAALENKKADKTSFTDLEIKVNKKVDITGDFQGTWKGLKPSQTNEFIQSQVDKNTSDIIGKASEGLRFMPPQAGRTPKLIYNSSDGNTYVVITKKPNSRGYILYNVKKGVVTNNNSYGGNAELQRVTTIQNLLDCVVYNHAKKGDTITGGLKDYSYNYSNGYSTSKALLFWTPVSVTGVLATDYVEFDLNVGENGKFNIPFLMTATSTNAAKIKLDGVEIATINLVKSDINTVYVKEFDASPGNHTLRIEVGQAQKNLYVAGTNLFHLKDYKNTQYDSYAYWQDTNAYVLTEGAMDYAMVEHETGLYCGSYHGGETMVTRKLYIDNVETNLANSTLIIGEVIALEQETNIINKLTANTVQKWDIDGVFDFYAWLSGNINVDTLYTCMTTTNDTFDEILFPKKYNITIDEDILLGRTNMVVQRNPVTKQKITTITTLFDNDNNPKTMYVRSVAGAYNKVYYGKVVYQPLGVNIKDISFQTTRIIE